MNDISMSNNEAALLKAEGTIQHIIRTITRCVDIIKSIQSFSVVDIAKSQSRSTNVSNKSRNGNNNTAPKLEDVLLYQILVKDGIETHVMEICKKLEMDTPILPSNIDNSIQMKPSLYWDRYQVVHQIFLPLIDSLATAYIQLDSLPTTNTNTTTSSTTENTTKPTNHKKNKKKNKPPPPKGLLSLSNYTDIACLLELLVCTSILPLMDPYILPNVNDRSRSLPRTLSGRLSKYSLLWGMVAMKDSSSNNNSQLSGDVISQFIRKELYATATVIGGLVILDRFRPMLLPRHALDIYATLFQVEQLDKGIKKDANVDAFTSTTTSSSSIKHNPRRTSIHNIFLHQNSITPSQNTRHNTTLKPTLTLDLHLQIKCLQSLLASGKKSPSWLRQRVGALLTSHAISNTEGIQAIVDIFVTTAASIPTNGITLASSRLGYTLCTLPHFCITSQGDKVVYFRALIGQLVGLLESCSTKVDIDDQSMSRTLTVWAVLENLPKGMIANIFLPMLIEGLLISPHQQQEENCNNEPNHSPSRRTSVPLYINRIYALFQTTPPSSGKSTGGALEQICLLLLSDQEKQRSSSEMRAIGTVSVFSQLLRLACDGQSKVVVQCEVQDRALSCLQLLVDIMLNKCTFNDVQNGDDSSKKWRTSQKLLATAFVQSVSGNTNDGNNKNQSNQQHGGEQEISWDALSRNNSSQGTDDLDLIQRRAEFLIDNIILPMQRRHEEESQHNHSDETKETTSSHNYKPIQSALFRLLLLMYFESTTSSSTSSYLPNSILNSLEGYKVVSMVFLPLLCEKCNHTSLLLENDGDGYYGIMQVINLFICSAANVHQYDDNGDNKTFITTESQLQLDDKQCNFRYCDISPSNQSIITRQNISDVHDMNHQSTQLSIISIVLSLLVIILELGSENRPAEEEFVLQQMVPALTSLSTLDRDPMFHASAITSDDEMEISTVLRAEIAEMASHAVALINSRKAVGTSTTNTERTNKGQHGGNEIDFILDKIKEAEKNLTSTHPPFRASAVVLLRQIVRGSTFENIVESRNGTSFTKDTQSPLIMEVNENNHNLTNTDEDHFTQIIEAMLRIAIMSLEDTESYVYLAGIQTIVALTDVCPSHILPILITLLTDGCMTIFGNDSERKMVKSLLQLSLNQRIKLAEALIFTIRRRGSVIYMYYKMFMNGILYGRNQFKSHADNDEVQNDVKFHEKALTETDQYFRNEITSAGEDDCSYDDMAEERRLRMNTGGPVFDKEEPDILRSACISVLAELVSSLHPATLSSYDATILKLCVHALAFDNSRPIRRAAGLLSREIYSRILREAININDLEDLEGLIKCFVSLLACDEALLHATLQRCTMGNDLDTKDNVAVIGKSRVYDQSTISRCEEALDAREALDDMGLINAASLIYNTQCQDESILMNSIMEKLRLRKSNTLI